MSTLALTIRANARALASWLRYEPRMRPDFREADHLTVAAVIAVIIAKGIDTAPTISAYLEDRGCRYGRDTIEFLLNAYDGGDSRQCVWWRNKSGHYAILGQL